MFLKNNGGLQSMATSSIRRFPFTIGFIVIFYGICMILVKSLLEKDLVHIFTTLAFGSVFAALLSYAISYRLTVCQGFENKWWRNPKILYPLGFLLVVGETLYVWNMVQHQVNANVVFQVAVFYLVGIYCLFPRFSSKKDDTLSWHFANNMIVNIGISFLLSSLFLLCIIALLLTIERLFSVKILQHNVPEYICVTVYALFAPLMVILFSPNREQSYNEQQKAHKFIIGAIKFLFLPVLLAFIAVFYVYIFKIAISWSLPKGMVSWPVSLMMGLFVAVYLSLYPERNTLSKKLSTIMHYLPLLVIPALMMMTIAITRRISDYGITADRLWVLTFNIWCYALSIGLFITKWARIRWILISFGIMFLLTTIGPWSFERLEDTYKRDTEKIEVEYENEIASYGYGSEVAEDNENGNQFYPIPKNARSVSVYERYYAQTDNRITYAQDSVLEIYLTLKNSKDTLRIPLSDLPMLDTLKNPYVFYPMGNKEFCLQYLSLSRYAKEPVDSISILMFKGLIYEK